MIFRYISEGLGINIQSHDSVDANSQARISLRNEGTGTI